MNPRERKAPGGVTGATATVAGPAPLLADTLRLALHSEAAPTRPSLWEELYRNASPSQREEMLALAGRQGFLYAHQVPSGSNGKKHAPGVDDLVKLQHLAGVLAGTQDLSPLRFEALSFFDSALDRHQREAVARALGTPDVCLIAGLPGTGKSRVLVEILRQAAARGERTLFVAPRPAAIDYVLEQIVRHDVLYPVRCLEPGEKSETVPAAVRGLVLSERVRKVRDALPGAIVAKGIGEQRRQRRRREEAVWPCLSELAASDKQLEQQRSAIRERLRQVGGQVGQEVEAISDSALPEGGFAFDFLGEQRRHQDTLAEISAALAKVEQIRTGHGARVSALETESRSLRPLAEAKQLGRWWTPMWWRARFRGDVTPRLAELDAQLAEARLAVAGAGAEAQLLGQKSQELAREHQSALNHLLQAEIERRHAELTSQESALNHEWKVLQDKWNYQVALLEHEALRPAAMSGEAIEAACSRWREQVRQDEASCKFAEQWAGFLQESAEALAGRLPALTNLVAGTITGCCRDPHFGESASFDLLIVEEAAQVTEAEFLKLAQRARRWVLVGEPACDSLESEVRRQESGVKNQVEGTAAKSRGKEVPVGPPLGPAPFFQRLWQRFRCDLRSLPYSWFIEGDRLGCRLRPILTEQRPCLESERVADFHDIELRILTLPGGKPVLAEVVFPPSMSLSQAKEYIYKELQELPIQTHGRCGCLLEEEDRFVFHLADPVDGPATTVALEQGVREVLTAAAGSADPAAWSTCWIEFDKSAGWRRGAVESWLKSHLQLRDPGRVVTLQVPYRMKPELCSVLSDLLFGEAYRQPRPAALGSSDHLLQPGGNGHGCPLVFVPVPSLRRDRPNGSTKATGSLPREGAGLEMDLAGPRQPDRLPADLRSELPGRGIVNYLEAQAVVRRLEELIQGPTSAIAVLALYAGQVELIKRLMRRSPRLCQSKVPVEVGLPSAFCHREFAVVLVSLTRSHGYRAVSFGEEASHVALALTRARTQVILFGDPGTLVRRGQWQGRLDHLDEAAARREGRLVNHLLRYLQGRGKHAQAFHLCEGCS